MKKRQIEYQLDPKSIHDASAEVRNFLNANKIGQSIAMRMGMVIEEVLLALRHERGESARLTLTLSRKLGRPWIVMQYAGKRFDPTDGNRQDPLSDQILNRLGITPAWSYRAGVNRITFRLPSVGVRSEVLLVGAVLLALLLGLMAGIIPEGVRAFLTNYGLAPVSNIFMHLLSTLAPMLIFLSILTSVAGSGGVETASTTKYVIARYLIATFATGLTAAFALIPFFRFHFGSGAGGGFSFDALFQMILDIVPGNLILPFSEGNMMQIILLAVLLGSIIRGLDNRVSGLCETLRELHLVFSNAVEFICAALPIFIFTSLTQMLWTNGIGLFATLWKPIVATILLLALHMVAYIGFVALRFRVAIPVLIRKAMPAFIVALTTASSIASYTRINEGNRKLGISQQCSDLSVPMGITLYCGTAVVMSLASMYYLAEVYQTAVSPGWFIMASVVCAIVAIASPPVSGGTLICLSLLMNYLNIPSAGLAVASTLTLVLDFFSTGSKVASLQMEVVLQADHLRMLDVDKLRKDC